MAKDTDMVGINDDIGTQIEEKQRTQIVEEIASHEEALEDTIKLKERHARQLARDKRIYEIRLEGENHRKITPVFKHEELDEYWKLIKDVLQDEYDENMQRGEGQQKSFDKQIENITSAIEDLKKDLAELDEE